LYRVPFFPIFLSPGSRQGSGANATTFEGMITMKQKVLLDTDIGTDIDDAVCLAYLLSQPACDLLGITTVSGEPVNRAMIASAICRAAGRDDIPIYPGCENPLLVPNRQTRAKQAEALPKLSHKTDFAKGQALRFLQDTIRANPGEITLLTIGPLTNIGALFTMDPEIPRLLKGLVMMCGVFTTRLPNSGVTEWNALLDPHATTIVYRAPVKVHRSIGLDVTMQVQMEAAEVRRRFSKGLLRSVLEFAEVWFQEAGVMTFHDPLAGTTLFDNSLCTFERGNVTVELAASERFNGNTAFAATPDGRHEVALGVHPGHFFDHYFSVF
jgi:purine nucleosidase